MQLELGLWLVGQTSGWTRCANPGADWRMAVSPLIYPVMIRPLSGDEGGGFLAAVPDLPGCMSDGETPEEAVTNVRDAILCWVEMAQEMGRSAPPPSAELKLPSRHPA